MKRLGHDPVTWGLPGKADVLDSSFIDSLFNKN